MSRNWYAVYTKPQKEKVVALSLSKKGIENFCPHHSAKSRASKKGFAEPLFGSYVFIHVREAELSGIKLVPGVVSVLYWKSKPAIIKSEEIDALKYMAVKCINIKVAKSVVSTVGNVYIKDEPIISFDDTALSVKSNVLRVSLPSLGFTLTGEKSHEPEVDIYETNETNLFRTFPKKINSFFFNN